MSDAMPADGHDTLPILGDPWLGLTFAIQDHTIQSGASGQSILMANLTGMVGQSQIGFAIDVAMGDWQADDVDGAGLPSWRGTVRLRALPMVTPAMAQVIATAMSDTPTGTGFRKLVCEAVAIGNDPAKLESLPCCLQLFLGDENDDASAAEIVLLIDLPKLTASLHESDASCRPALARWLTGELT